MAKRAEERVHELCAEVKAKNDASRAPQARKPAFLKRLMNLRKKSAN
jgi:hypothetical protein